MGHGYQEKLESEMILKHFLKVVRCVRCVAMLEYFDLIVVLAYFEVTCRWEW